MLIFCGNKAPLNIQTRVHFDINPYNIELVVLKNRKIRPFGVK